MLRNPLMPENKAMSLLFRLTSIGFAIGFAVLIASKTLPAFSQTNYPLTALLRCSREEPIIQALQLLQNSNGEDSLSHIVNKPVRIVFRNMQLIHKDLKNYDALSWLSNQGEQVIFINEKHRAAPPEALAAMIAHEAMHDDPFNSLQEEVQSWKHEAEVWGYLKARNPALMKISAGQNALVDRENRIEKEAQHGTLTAFVLSNPGYTGLPEVSPGFGDTSISTQVDAAGKGAF